MWLESTEINMALHLRKSLFWVLLRIMIWEQPLSVFWYTAPKALWEYLKCFFTTWGGGSREEAVSISGQCWKRTDIEYSDPIYVGRRQRLGLLIILKDSTRGRTTRLVSLLLSFPCEFSSVHGWRTMGCESCGKTGSSSDPQLSVSWPGWLARPLACGKTMGNHKNFILFHTSVAEELNFNFIVISLHWHSPM